MATIENYFDYAATTPVHPRAAAAMQRYFQSDFGNPSSAHAFGQVAFHAVQASRDSLLTHFNAPAGSEIVFTGSSTEAANLVIWSRAIDFYRRTGRPGLILISATEHAAVRNTVSQLEAYGFCRMKVIPVDSAAILRLDVFEASLAEDPVLVSIIGANNELGTVQPVREVVRMCQAAGVPYHCDATQLVAHSLLDLTECPVDYLTFSGHKCYAPKGIGALIAREPSSLRAHIFGAGQERGLRAGTENVPYIVAIAEAYRLLKETYPERVRAETGLRERLIGRVLDEVPDVRLTGDPESRLSNHASFSFKGIDSLMLQSALDQEGYAVSIGSACRSNQVRGQQQLVEIGLPPDWLSGGLRITNGLYSTPESVDGLVGALKEAVSKIRGFLS
ncbi:hypothetical protein BEQ56_08235 [Anaerolineaceae bacterium oral taxon 439]|nr:hypothetical protein BEQ56_08235 [Anaerolineaceae bacterium oral taxon 439]